MFKYTNKILTLKRCIVSLVSNLGLIHACVYAVQMLRHSLLNSDSNYTLISKNSNFPLICRPNTSDLSVFGQIFLEREYSCLDDLSDVELIIDCGANVGYSSAYLLTRFPKSRVICIEPDSSNFKILEKNLAPYKERVKLINSGVWSHQTGLKILETPGLEWNAWAVQVRECNAGEVPEMQATDVGTLLKESGSDKISILKMDIEGAEAVVFAKNYESWLPFVDNIAIEIHGSKASDIVLNTVATCKPFNISNCGELTVFKSNV
ncbi:FkbM family methyltransferase [Chamaesiphon minutus]|uniref:Methyltransferase, FkbM family n=1 Tax=Chamaesiphon minutus (strain ATCC 27169 / PCC 6605) TaxID=1173020 RepID=K9UL94_CHAP6|nr:FkbM family methyltransferase [Chamaesiphon minutus]AFY95600.1 methyltransferase, FkbM family [Chamaesiphon minutus PCC 6605]